MVNGLGAYLVATLAVLGISRSLGRATPDLLLLLVWMLILLWSLVGIVRTAIRTFLTPELSNLRKAASVAAILLVAATIAAVLSDLPLVYKLVAQSL